MDASHKLSKTALILTAALSLAANAFGQSISVSPPSSSSSPVSISSTTPTSFTVTGGSGGYVLVGQPSFGTGPTGWFSVGPQSASSSVPFTAQSNALCPAGQTCTGSFVVADQQNTSDTVTVYVTSAAGSGGTGGTNGGFGVNTTSVVIAPGGSTTVTLSNTTGSQVNFNITASSSGSWLNAYQIGTSQTCFPSGANNCIAPGATVTLQLWVTNYTSGEPTSGTVIVSPVSSSLNPIDIFVTVGNSTSVTGSLIPNPSAVTLSYPGTYSQTVSVTTTSSEQFFTATPSTTNGIPWLAVNGYTATISNLPVSSSTPGSPQLFIQITTAAVSMATGTYSGSITLANANNSSDITVIPVTLTINGGNGTTSTLATPTALTFTCESDGTTNCVPAVQTQTILVNDNTPTAGTVTYNSGWPNDCGVGPSPAGNIMYVTLRCGGPVTPGNTYTGQFTVTSSLGYQQQITVNLVATNSATLIAQSNYGGTVLCIDSSGSCATQTLQLLSSDSSTTLTVNSVTPSASWITTSGCTGSTSIANCTVSISPSGLTNGLNSASLAVNWQNGSSAQQTLTIPVAVLVSNSVVTGPLTFNPTSLAFSGTNPSAQTVNVIGQNLYFTAQVTSGTWLSISPTSGTATTSGTPVTVSVNTSGLAPNTYTGQISFTPSGGTAQTYTVTLTVPSGTVTVSPTTLSFTAQVGGATTAAQQVAVSSTSGASGVSFSYNSAQSWILVSATPTGTGSTSGTGSTPTTLYISVNPSGLSTGNYSGTVSIGAATLNVNLTVSPAASVSASATSLTFSYTAGSSGPSPSSGTVTVSGTAGAQFTASATSNGNWLALSSTSGTIPASGSTTLTVSLQNLTSLSVSSTPYTGTITVAGTGGATGSTTLNASLTVSAPLPTVTSVTNAASFNTGPLSAGEIIAIFGTQMGPSTGVPLMASDITNNTLPFTLGGVSVTVGGYPAPILYASATQVSAVVPYQINSPVFLLNVPVIVKYLNQTSNGWPETQVAAQPGIFTANSSGSGPGAILNSDLSFNCNCSAGRPANKGETVVLYVTGEGQTLPAGKTGVVNPSAPPFAQPVQAPAVTINGQPAQVAFYGEAPGLVAGVLQVNVVVPSSAASGQDPVVISFGNAFSQMTSGGTGAVTVAVK